MTTERGPQGDHGQPGAPGETGRPGVDLDPAATRAIATRTQRNVTLVRWLAVLVILAVTVAAYLIDRQQRALSTEIRYSCEARNLNVTNLNAAFDALSDIDSRLLSGPGSTALQRQIAAQRTAIYESARQELENCGGRR